MEKIESGKNSVYIRILLIISLLSVAAFIVFMIWNPLKGVEDKRNSQRNSDVVSILDAVATYTKANGKIPMVIPENENCATYGNEICKTGVSDCKNHVDLSAIMTSIPVDPARISATGTGYYISQDGQGNIIVCAPYAERNVNILTTRFAF